MIQDKNKRFGGRRFWILALLALALLAAAMGAATQTGALTQFFAKQSDPDGQPVAQKRRELSLGRIVANLRGTGLSQVSHLILDPVLAYDVPANVSPEDPGLEPMKAELRDAFIDYLAGVSVDEISGSAGLANLRFELLRRARVVVGSDSPRAVLLQEYILQ